MASVRTVKFLYSICTVGTATWYSSSFAASCSKKSWPGRLPTDSSLLQQRQQQQQQQEQQDQQWSGNLLLVQLETPC
jgi:hypothetical protein